MYFDFKLLVSLFLIAECRIEGLSAVTSLGVRNRKSDTEEGREDRMRH